MARSSLDIFWGKFFYVPPSTWVALTTHCKTNCSGEHPNVREDICQGCSAMKSYLGSDHMVYKYLGWGKNHKTI